MKQSQDFDFVIKFVSYLISSYVHWSIYVALYVIQLMIIILVSYVVFDGVLSLCAVFVIIDHRCWRS